MQIKVLVEVLVERLGAHQDLVLVECLGPHKTPHKTQIGARTEGHNRLVDKATRKCWRCILHAA